MSEAEGAGVTDGLPDLSGILEQAQQLQEQLASAQAELAKRRVSGSAGGGQVTATVNGGGELVGLTIGRDVIDPDEPEVLADLVLAAYRDAAAGAAEVQREALDPLTGGLGSAEPGV